MTIKLESQILKALVSKGVSIIPIDHCPDGDYLDYDEWDGVNVDGKEYDINFYSDGKKFYIQAYPLKLNKNGLYDRENDDFFNVQIYDLVI
jgi:hypothetical protein